MPRRLVWNCWRFLSTSSWKERWEILSTIFIPTWEIINKTTNRDFNLYYAPFQTQLLTVLEGCTFVTLHLACFLQRSPRKTIWNCSRWSCAEYIPDTMNYVVWNYLNLKAVFCCTNLWCCFPLRTLRLFAGGHRDQRSWGVEYTQVSAGQTEWYENRHNSIQYIPISSWIVTRSRTLKDVSSLSGWQHRWHTKLTCMVVLDDLEPSIAGLQEDK